MTGSRNESAIKMYFVRSYGTLTTMRIFRASLQSKDLSLAMFSLLSNVVNTTDSVFAATSCIQFLLQDCGRNRVTSKAQFFLNITSTFALIF